MWKIIISAGIGFLAANIVNIIEMIMIRRVMLDVQKMLKDMKKEGKTDKWLT